MMSERHRGKLLVSSSDLRDGNFYQAVVLLLEHSDDGAMGLVINRPSEFTVGKILSDCSGGPGCEQPVFIGGPVENNALFILHRRDTEDDLVDDVILPGICVAGSRDTVDGVLQRLMDDATGSLFRVFCGYAGWSPGQLDAEIARGDWHVQSATAELVFDSDPYACWDACIGDVRKATRLIPQDIENPEWN